MSHPAGPSEDLRVSSNSYWGLVPLFLIAGWKSPICLRQKMGQPSNLLVIVPILAPYTPQAATFHQRDEHSSSISARCTQSGRGGSSDTPPIMMHSACYNDSACFLSESAAVRNRLIGEAGV